MAGASRATAKYKFTPAEKEFIAQEDVKNHVEFSRAGRLIKHFVVGCQSQNSTYNTYVCHLLIVWKAGDWQYYSERVDYSSSRGVFVLSHLKLLDQG